MRTFSCLDLESGVCCVGYIDLGVNETHGMGVSPSRAESQRSTAMVKSWHSAGVKTGPLTQR